MTAPAVEEVLTLPNLGDEAAKKFTSKIVRDYVRNFLIEPAIKRVFAIGMGEVTFQQAFAVKDGAKISVEIIETEAPAAVQVKALHDILALGVPPRVMGDEGAGRVAGVIILGETNMVEARRRATEDRLLAMGSVPTTEYVPPPGYEVVIVEDDLSGSKPPASPDDPPTLQPVKTKAQQLAASRRAKAKK